MLIVTGFLLILALTAATGYFVAQEFSFVAADRSKLQSMAANGDIAAERALRITARLSFMLSGAQLGITVTALLAGYVAEPYLGAGLADILGLVGVSSAVSLPIAVTVALVIATVVQMVLGELAPKNWGIAKPEAIAKALSRSTMAYLIIAGPLIRVFDGAANRLLRLVGIQPVEELAAGATHDDLDHIVAESRDRGHLNAPMALLLEHGLDFRDLTAGQVMVPRVDVVTINATEPATRVVELFTTGRSRFPVIGAGGVDDVVGVVGAAQVLALVPAKRATTPVGAIADLPLRVPSSLPLPVVLERLRAAHRQLAIVVDEYGGCAGVISLEDIAEEFVGSILDEDDREEPTAVRQDDGSWLVPARWRVDEVTEATGFHLPVSDTYETISGLVLCYLGRIPTLGATVRIDVPAVSEGNHAAWSSPSSLSVLAEVVRMRRHVPDTVRLSVSREGTTR